MTPPRTARPGTGAPPPTSATRDEQARDTEARATAQTREREIADERLADVLVQLVGGYLRDRIDPEDPRHYQYFEWLAEEARAAQTPEERAQTAREAEAFARRVMRDFDEMNDGAPVEESGAMPCVRDEPMAHAPRGSATSADAVREAAHAGYAPRFALSVAAGVGRDLWDEPADAWLEVPADVPPGQHVALAVHGDSMRPLLHDGDTLLVRLGAEVATGDVVVARRPDHGYVVKRVAAITADAWRLASDNAAYEEFTLPRDPALLVGTVVLRWCTHGNGMK
jgi:phage repressor protein C with HTH and peptisase S24 domain